ncbi:MAG: diacylglycerol kinase family lipid kinase [Chloroflexota bacterium]|nr:diacylglycerol kinase family lipid kinase [Chloroflexota bacterium]
MDTPDRSQVKSRRKISYIINPATRRDAEQIAGRIQAARPDGVEIEIAQTAEAGDAIRLAQIAARTSSLVVACGGDGTVADVTTGIFGTDVPLGIIPAGSTNITARDLGIPTRLESAIALTVGSHRLTTIDVGRCGERCFLHIAGAGIDSRFFADTDRSLKRRIGWLAYLPPAVRALRVPPARFQLTVDSRSTSVTSPLILVANGGSIITPALHLAENVRRDDGLLDLLIFTARGLGPVTRTLGALMTMQLTRSSHLVRLQARQISIDATPAMPIQLDGDVVAQTPAQFTIAPAALQVVTPIS